ncbi:MAG: class I SAM-dependent methyltransferase [Acidimicrobiales bacterium]
MNTYAELFEERGSTYDDAMARWPTARSEEFGFVLGLAQPQPGERLYDIPAGGGYLAEHLKPDVVYTAIEVSASFAQRCRVRGVDVVEGDLQAASLPAECADVVVSLAGVHHEPHLAGLLSAWHRLLRPGGRLVVADVAAGSAVATFLDGYVGDHNGVGHRGGFLGPEVGRMVEEAGFVDVEVVDRHYHWWCEDALALGRYCKALFDLKAPPPAEVLAALVDGPGVDHDIDGNVGLRWALRAVVGQRPE